jgi:hypothetical protein
MAHDPPIGLVEKPLRLRLTSGPFLRSYRIEIIEHKTLTNCHVHGPMVRSRTAACASQRRSSSLTPSS